MRRCAMKAKEERWFEAATLALMVVLSAASHIAKPQADLKERTAVLATHAHEGEPRKE
jgi:hypothetical protein